MAAAVSGNTIRRLIFNPHMTKAVYRSNLPESITKQANSLYQNADGLREFQENGPEAFRGNELKVAVNKLDAKINDLLTSAEFKPFAWELNDLKRRLTDIVKLIDKEPKILETLQNPEAPNYDIKLRCYGVAVKILSIFQYTTNQEFPVVLGRKPREQSQQITRHNADVNWSYVHENPLCPPEQYVRYTIVNAMHDRSRFALGIFPQRPVASEEDSIAHVTEICHVGAELNSCHRDLPNLLHVVLEPGVPIYPARQLKILQVLLANGANPNHVGMGKRLPLAHKITLSGEIDQMDVMFPMLLDAGMDVNIPFTPPESTKALTPIENGLNEPLPNFIGIERFIAAGAVCDLTAMVTMKKIPKSRLEKFQATADTRIQVMDRVTGLFETLQNLYNLTQFPTEMNKLIGTYAVLKPSEIYNLVVELLAEQSKSAAERTSAISASASSKAASSPASG